MNKQRIKQVQAALIAAGHDVGWVDGVAGPRTLSALSDYYGDPVTKLTERMALDILSSCNTAPTLQVMSAEGMVELIHSEGERSKMYHDSAGLPTIGVGHLLTQPELMSGKINIKGTWVKWRDGLTKAQIHDLLDQDNDKAEAAVRSAVTAPMTQGQFDALVSFTFNVGGEAFKTSTLLRKFNAGLIDQTRAQFERWVYAGGRKIAGLATRRKREAEMFDAVHLA